MFTTSQTLRDIAEALDFLSGYDKAGLRQMGSLAHIMQKFQEMQVNLGKAEEEIKELTAASAAKAVEDERVKKSAFVKTAEKKKLN